MDIRIGRMPRRISSTFACVALAGLVAACGGGGGAPASSQSTGGGTSAPESAYLLAEFVAQDANNQFVRVWDPAHPEVAIQNVRIVESNGIAWSTSRLAFSDATSYDPATRSMRTLGHAKVFFDNDGKAYSIDLRGGQPHAPVQLSSAADVEGFARVVPLGADGVDAWLAATGGSHHWAIRSTMAATDAPQAVADIVPLRDASTGLPQYLLLALGGGDAAHPMPTTYAVTDLGLAALDVPAVAAMTNPDGWVGPDPAQAGLGYLAIGGQLRALRWGAAGVSVDAGALYTLGSPGQPWAARAVADADALYLSDARTLLAIGAGSVRAVGTFAVSPYALTDAGTAIVAQEPDPQTVVCCQTVEAMAKADGRVTRVAHGDVSMQLPGATAQGVLLVGTDANPQGFDLVATDGSLLTSFDGLAVGVVRSSSVRLDHSSAPLAVLTCTAMPDGGCGSGVLARTELSGGVSSTLGTLTASDEFVQGDLVDGLVGVLAGQTYLSPASGFGNHEVDRRDAWQLDPGSAGSLRRVTNNLP